jgi:hypothetical protein
VQLDKKAPGVLLWKNVGLKAYGLVETRNERIEELEKWTAELRGRSCRDDMRGGFWGERRGSGGKDLGVVSGAVAGERGGVDDGGEGLKEWEGRGAGAQEMETGLWAFGGLLMVAPFSVEEVLDRHGMGGCMNIERKNEREYVGMLLPLYKSIIMKDSTEHDVYESGFARYRL